MANLKVFVLSIIGLFRFIGGQSNTGLTNGRPFLQSSHSSPCRYYSNDYDEVNEDRQGKGLLLAAAGGAAVGYYLGTKHQNQPVINNNIYNEYNPPCVNVQGGLGGGGSGGGGGIVGGILGHHPILSNIIQGVHGGLLNGNGIGSWINGNGQSTGSANRINWNRAIRQFNRVVRVII